MQVVILNDCRFVENSVYILCVCVCQIERESRWTSSVSPSASIGRVTQERLPALRWRSLAAVNNKRKCHVDV